MGDRLSAGVGLFNQGRYFEAHEVWEDLWRETEGEARLFYQGLVQVAVGLHHLARGNRRGGERVLARGLDKLRAYPEAYAGLDTADLAEQLRTPSPGAVRIRPAR